MRESIIMYLSLHCHHQNDSCIKMGSDESHFNVSLTVKDKVTRQCPQTTTFLKRKESRKRNRADALVLASLTPYHWPRPAHKYMLSVRLKSEQRRNRKNRLASRGWQFRVGAC